MNWFKRVGWYSVSAETLQRLAKFLAVLVVLGVGYVGYRQWDQSTIERRAFEVLDRARGLQRMMGGETRGAHRNTLQQADLNIRLAEDAWERRAYHDALAKARISRGLLLDVQDALRNPMRAGDARFIYIEGDVEIRRGETGQFRSARIRDVLYEGDYVRSGTSGSAEVLFDADGTLFTVRPGTMLKVRGSTARLPQTVQMEYGWVDLSTKDTGSGVLTEVAELRVSGSSTASVAVERGGSGGKFIVGSGSGELSEPDGTAVQQLGALQQIVRRDGAWGLPTRLPPTPEMAEPPNNTDVNIDRLQRVVLSWEPVQEAAGYDVQISRSRLFSEPLVDERLAKAELALGLRAEGDFMWRVAAVGRDGVQSPWSSPRKFRVVSLGGVDWQDNEAPDLHLASIHVNGSIVIITGTTEPGVRLEIEGQRIPVAADGSFSTSFASAESGKVPIEISAVDASGNQRIATRQVLIEEL